jgi:hypothetical protein
MPDRIRSVEDADAGRFATAEERFAVLLSATMRTQSGACDIHVRNISAGGLMAKSAAPPHPGTVITVSMRDRPTLTGRVAWARGDCFGMSFDERIDPIAFMGWNPESSHPIPMPPPAPMALPAAG